jgi:hypothetical protein
MVSQSLKIPTPINLNWHGTAPVPNFIIPKIPAFDMELFPYRITQNILLLIWNYFLIELPKILWWGPTYRCEGRGFRK